MRTRGQDPTLPDSRASDQRFLVNGAGGET